MTDKEEAVEPLFIKDLIRRVHQELWDSRLEREQSGEDPIFAVESMTLEVNFVALSSRDRKGGLDFRVITVGGINVGGANHFENQQVHKVTLTLNALVSAPTNDDSDLVGLSPDGTRFLPRRHNSGW